MTESDLSHLLEKLVNQPSEQEWLEFKMNAGSITNEQIGEYISALSNGATIANKPFGYLVWGVKDENFEIKGTNFNFAKTKQGNQALEIWLRNLIHPKINFEIFEFKYYDKSIVLIKIPSAKGEPTHFQKKAYIRIGSVKTDLRNYPDLIRIIYNSRYDWSAAIINNATIQNLDSAAVRLARQKFKEKNNKAHFLDEVDQWSDELFLDKAKITIDGKITNTAIILLGNEEASHLLLPGISEITWKLETEEKAYEHFGPPFLINTSRVLHNIRNVKYKFFPDNELLSTTVNKYDTRSILEALNNCIAHQDYSLNSRIIVAEKIDRLIFSNAGSFFEGRPEDYTEGDKTPDKYRNPWLANAMVNLGMIDRLGYGIHTIYLAQRNRFFPLPDYTISDPQKVILQIYGHAIDLNYSKMLIERKDLTLDKVVLLDRIQKNLPITDEAAVILKKERLIEGRKPRFYVAASVAAVTNNKAAYIKNKAFDDEHYKKMIEAYLNKFRKASRHDIEDLISEKLSDVLTDNQKKHKIKNILQSMKNSGRIILNKERLWELHQTNTK